MNIFNPEQIYTMPCKCGASIDIKLTLSDLVTGELDGLLEEQGWGETDFRRDRRGVMQYELSCPDCVEELEREQMLHEE